MARARSLILSDGFLEMCRRNSVGKYSWRLPESGAMLRLYDQCANAEERNELCAAMNLVGRELQRGHRTCPLCLRFHGQCICDWLPHCDFVHRTWVYQHSREYHTLDNTGKLIVIVSNDPGKSRRVIAGAPEQEYEMVQSIWDAPETSLVLVQPLDHQKQHTISFQEFRHRQFKSFGTAATQRPLNIIVPDCSNPTQFRENVRRIRRLSPPVPLVKISPQSRQSWLDSESFIHPHQIMPTVQILAELFHHAGDVPAAKALRIASSTLSSSRQHGITVRIDGRKHRA